MKRDIILFLEDILENIERIENSTKTLSKEDFDKSLDIQDATIRRIEVMGESVKNIPESFRQKYPEIEWRKIAGSRDVIIHHHFGINLETIWIVVKDELPELKEKVSKVLTEEIKEILKKEEKQKKIRTKEDKI